MKALILRSNADLYCDDVPLPARPSGEKTKTQSKSQCLIRVKAAGVCGSDLHRAFENGAYHYPLIMGHEFSGVIEEPAPGGRLQKGQEVVGFPLIPCRKCRACQTGDFAQCTDYDYFGSRRDGGFAEYLWIAEENLFRLPDHLDPVQAAMTEPCAVSLHGVRKLNLQGGETTVVFGGGPIGNMTAQWLRIMGSGRIMIVDIDDRKLAIAAGMGFETIDASSSDPVASIMDTTSNQGADLVIEACGLPVTYRQALQAAALFGQVLMLGTLTESMELTSEDFSLVLRRELSLHGTWNSRVVPRGRDDWSTVLRFLGRELQVESLISHTPPLEDGPEILTRMFKGGEFFNKVMFLP